MAVNKTSVISFKFQTFRLQTDPLCQRLGRKTTPTTLEDKTQKYPLGCRLAFPATFIFPLPLQQEQISNKWEIFYYNKNEILFLLFWTSVAILEI